MRKEITIAIIAGIVSILVAIISAFSATKSAIVHERQRISGGTVSRTGQKLTSIGRSFTISGAGAAKWRITFDQPFQKPPIALLTTYQEGSPTTARIEFIDERSLVVVTRLYTNEIPSEAPFSFMVLESLEDK